MQASSAPPSRADRRLARRGGVVELLAFPAMLFGVAARLRSTLYDRGWLRVLEIDVPVVSVGNLTVGGTGKTPMVEWLVEACRRRGLSPGLLSRGYGRAGGQELNDEGRQLHERFPAVPHVQDRDRVAGAARLADLGVDVILLDDGFQHRRLHRDLDIVLVDATRPWGLAPAGAGEAPVRALLPRGLLREPAAALARADLVVVTRCDAVEPANLEGLCAELARLAPGTPIRRARHAPAALRRLAAEPSADEEVELEALAGREVDLASGIGNPQSFEAAARSIGARVAEHRAFPDHHAFAPADLDGLGGRPVVVTAKDAVKLRGASVPLFVLDVRLELVDGEAELDALLDALPESQRRRERRAMHEGLHG